MEKILTVVIPSYNVEKYLEQTLDSFIVSDKEIMNSIEVLIVDDGSKDNTANLGKTYEAKYPGIFRVISKENGGHGSTINRGILEARGRYFKVVDGDDWVDTDDFYKLVEVLKACTSDYVVTNYTEVFEDTKEKYLKEFSFLIGKATSINDINVGRDIVREHKFKFDELLETEQLPMHSLVIKASILKDNRIKLDEHCFYVDVEYILYPIPFVNAVSYYDLNVYQYRLNQATQSVSIEGYRRHIQNHIDVILHLSEFARQYAASENVSDKKLSFIEKRIAQMVGDQITIFMSYDAEDTENQDRFEFFEDALEKINKSVYEKSTNESKALALLRKNGFVGYKTIMKLAKWRNHI